MRKIEIQLDLYRESYRGPRKTIVYSGYGDELGWTAAWLLRATNKSSSPFSADDKRTGLQALVTKITDIASSRRLSQKYSNDRFLSVLVKIILFMFIIMAGERNDYRMISFQFISKSTSNMGL